MQSNVLLATSWLNIGRLIQPSAADVVVSVDRVFLPQQPPDSGRCTLMHEEDGVTGRGLDVGHLDQDLG